MAKKLRTSICDTFGIEYPILLAGMGQLMGMPPISGPKLTAAVSEAGGLGVLGAGGLKPNELREAIREIRSMTDKPFGIDIVSPSETGMAAPSKSVSEVKAEVAEKFPQQLALVERLREELKLPKVDVVDVDMFRPELSTEQLEVGIEEKVPVVAFALGTSAAAVSRAHAGGMKVISLIGNVKNARRVKELGADVIVAQGHDGGGHNSRIGTMALIPQVVDAVYPTPVLAAGGIGDGRGVVAALALGAQGVWVGTKFQATWESGVPDLQRENLVKATEEDTVISKIWSGKNARSYKNPMVTGWDRSGIPYAPMPFQTPLIAPLWYGALVGKNWEVFRLGGGQIMGMIKEIKSAKEVVNDMVEEAIDILKNRFPAEINI